MVSTHADEELRCPACDAREVRVTPARASSCTPFPPVEPLQCLRCGNTGTRMRLRGRDVVQWSRAR